ncbi:hypothetical protein H5410_005968 [Solanum commersonii]|uniref:DUF4283 domain-containing protein n=1 Tax=Solanum commersonii TaxID=4109 RepID=A0A9J6A7V9_SOLCO|nr:hypothetical protein H5410_005968 [Solanum commersonii]
MFNESSQKRKYRNVAQNIKTAARKFEQFWLDAHAVFNLNSGQDFSETQCDQLIQMFQPVQEGIGASTPNVTASANLARDSPTVAAIERYIALQVNTISRPEVYYHNDGYFLVRFSSLDDRNEVLYSGPHMLNNKPIIVKVWSADFNFNKEVLQRVPI